MDSLDTIAVLDTPAEPVTAGPEVKAALPPPPPPQQPTPMIWYDPSCSLG